MPTSGFVLGAERVAFDDGAIWDVVVTSTDSGDVYRRQALRDWIRVDPEGRYSQRVYLERGPAMAFGLCE